MGLRGSTVTALILCLVLCLVQVEGRRGGGGRSRSSSGRSSWGSSSNKNNYGSSSSSSGGRKKFSNRLKTAAAVGAGAYVGYQLGKMTGRFGNYHHGGSWGHSQYNTWRQKDGMLCRNTEDCTWMDKDLICQDYEMDFSMDRGWFGGDYLAIIGDCECRRGMDFDNWELRCEPLFLGVGVAAILGMLLLSLCCCGCGFGIFKYYRR